MSLPPRARPTAFPGPLGALLLLLSVALPGAAGPSSSSPSRPVLIHEAGTHSSPSGASVLRVVRDDLVTETELIPRPLRDFIARRAVKLSPPFRAVP